jgi:hypothetical protein
MYRSIKEIEEKFFPNQIRESVIASSNLKKIAEMFSDETIDKIQIELKNK